jgi:HEAT repeat protein
MNAAPTTTSWCRSSRLYCPRLLCPVFFCPVSAAPVSSLRPSRGVGFRSLQVDPNLAPCNNLPADGGPTRDVLPSFVPVDHAVTFARHFSRLVWLLMHQADSVDEQKAALRALVTLSKQGAVVLTVRHDQLTVNGEALPPALTGVQEVRSQFQGHAVEEMVVDIGAHAADLLGIARVLAAAPTSADEGREVSAKIRALAPRSVRVSFSRPPVDVDPTVVRAFTTIERPNESAEEFFARLDAATSVGVASRILDQVVALVEGYARTNKTAAVAELMAKVVIREAQRTDPDMKRAFAAAVRRLSKPTTLRAVAAVLPRRKDRVDDLLAVLARTGDEGAEALIEQLTAAQSLSERRIFFDALVRLKAGSATLVHMLGDPRWYVARNAADLLGELNATEADVALTDLLKHDDDRVRRAAAHALGKLGTAHAVVALRKALKDQSPHVRALAATGLSARKGARSAGTLVRALETEPDLEVQIAILNALGKVANAEAVQRLIKAAEPAGALFKRKATAYRLAAVQGLGEARTPVAMAALRELATDKDREVREAVARALAHVDRAEPTTLA